MRFLIGFIMGVTVGRHAMTTVDKQLGHLIRPKLVDLTYNLHQRANSFYDEDNNR